MWRRWKLCPRADRVVSIVVAFFTSGLFVSFMCSRDLCRRSGLLKINLSRHHAKGVPKLVEIVPVAFTIDAITVIVSRYAFESNCFPPYYGVDLLYRGCRNWSATMDAC